ncbi:MAG: class I SAM-dependent methyltransferase [Eubacteriales bacterium]|nr:class I SAM-dependent methyltransferase [Eubacteriales bacterium]
MSIILDERLKTVAEQFSLGAIGADIGADHGKLSAYLLINNICSYMYVSDVSEVSVAKSKHLLEKHGLLDKSTVLLSDGFDNIPKNIDTAAICGLGGKSIAAIIKRLPRLNMLPKLILSPHTDLPIVRQTLMQINYKIIKETVVWAKGRFYHIINAEQGLDTISKKEIYIGKNLNASSRDLLIKYYDWRFNVEKAKKQDDNPCLDWILEELHTCLKQA